MAEPISPAVIDVLRTILGACGPDTSCTVLIDGVIATLAPKWNREQVIAAMEKARVAGMVVVKIGAIGVTDYGIEIANRH